MLASVDADLCEQVAAGLGLPAPKSKPAKPWTQSPALAQIRATPCPIEGRIVGVVAGARRRPGRHRQAARRSRPRAPCCGHRSARRAAHAGRHVEIVERTFATGRSIEFDAVVVADGAPKDVDISVLVMLQEAFRH